MNKPVIISESIKAYFSSHAALAAIGTKVKKLKVFEPVVKKRRYYLFLGFASQNELRIDAARQQKDTCKAFQVACKRI